jgi:hypothetical protein
MISMDSTLSAFRIKAADLIIIVAVVFITGGISPTAFLLGCLDVVEWYHLFLLISLLKGL